ncbi:MAG TPA: hypothetical protein VMF14_08800 [Solirubrobacteraceae bacterium]|nr:hypothetical protein [Solirubrobacteraceae bacterium]
MTGRSWDHAPPAGVREAPDHAARRPAVPAGGRVALPGALGNRALGQLLRSLQRSPDWTKPQSNVSGTGITRLEVHGLAFGTGEFQDSYTVSGKPEKSDEANKTAESPKHMAVVLVPDKLDPNQPVQVVVHFHGWGFRFDENAHDPYAGYLVAKGGAGRPAAGTVRDVDQEHWEQQVASLKGQGPQVVTILAQGRGTSDFGSFPTFEYVRDVLLKSGRSELKTVADNEKYSIVLSAHSGGGSKVISTILAGNEAETSSRTALKPQDIDAKQHRVVNKLQPVDLVVLYEAINVPDHVDQVMAWVNRHLDALGTGLGKTPDKAGDLFAATPVLRGYFGKRNSGYAKRYCDLACRIEKAIEAKIPDRWHDDAADHFRVIEVAGPRGGEVEHEQVLSGVSSNAAGGSIADALRAQRDPKSDRAQAVHCEDCRAELKAWADAARKADKPKTKP